MGPPLKTSSSKLSPWDLSNRITFELQVAREASLRVLGLRPFDVQLMGGMILHEGNLASISEAIAVLGMIAEMSTGEGKTLVSVLPAYLNALTEKVTPLTEFNEGDFRGCTL